MSSPIFRKIVSLVVVSTTACVLFSAVVGSKSTGGLDQLSVASAEVKFAQLLPPLYRNVSAGGTWVYPSSAYDIGARDMTCECFNPDSESLFPNASQVSDVVDQGEKSVTNKANT